MPRQTSNMTKVNVLFDPKILEALKWLAKAKGTTYSELIRAIIKERIVEEIKKEQETIQLVNSVTDKEVAAG